MKWYWRALSSLVLLVPGSIAFGFLQALYEVPALTRAQDFILYTKHCAYLTLAFWTMGMLR